MTVCLKSREVNPYRDDDRFLVSPGNNLGRELLQFGKVCSFATAMDRKECYFSQKTHRVVN